MKEWRADTTVFSQASCWGAYSEMLALKRAGRPYVSISQLNTPFSWPGDKLYRIVGDAFDGAQKSVFVSQGNLDLFESQIARPLKNAQVIYNPHAFDVSTQCDPLEGNDLRLSNVARIDPAHKGQDLLINTLALEHWRKRNISLKIAGSGDESWLVKGPDSNTLLRR